MLSHYVIFGNCVWDNHYTVWGIITSFFVVNQGWLFEFAPAINNPIWYICVLLWLYLLYYFIEYTFKTIGGKKEVSQEHKHVNYSCCAFYYGNKWAL